MAARRRPHAAIHSFRARSRSREPARLGARPGRSGPRAGRRRRPRMVRARVGAGARSRPARARRRGPARGPVPHRRGRRSAGGGVLPAAQPRAEAPGRGHLHAAGHRRVDGRLGRGRRPAGTGRRPGRGLGTLRGGRRAPLPAGPGRGGGAGSRGGHLLPRPPGGGRARRARPRGGRRLPGAPARRPPPTARAPSTWATRRTCATTRSRPAWKEWLTLTAARTAWRRASSPGCTCTSSWPPRCGPGRGDRGAFITSSEWLDTNYGAARARAAPRPLGGEAVHILEPTAMPFDDAAVTAAITCFRVERPPASVRLRRVRHADELGPLRGGVPVDAERLREARRWSPAHPPGGRGARGPRPAGRDLPRPPRGRHGQQRDLGGPAGRHRPARRGPLPRDHARAGDLRRRAHPRLRAAPAPGGRPAGGARRLRGRRSCGASGASSRRARRLGAHSGYIARARRAWWSVGLRAPAPILATYMARRPPAFTRNLAQAPATSTSPTASTRAGSCPSGRSSAWWPPCARP